MTTTKTPSHTISRTTENVGPFGLFDSANKTTVTDRTTNTTTSGYGRTSQEADQRAFDRQISANVTRISGRK